MGEEHRILARQGILLKQNAILKQQNAELVEALEECLLEYKAALSSAKILRGIDFANSENPTVVKHDVRINALEYKIAKYEKLLQKHKAKGE